MLTGTPSNVTFRISYPDRVVLVLVFDTPAGDVEHDGWDFVLYNRRHENIVSVIVE